MDTVFPTIVLASLSLVVAACFILHYLTKKIVNFAIISYTALGAHLAGYLYDEIASMGTMIVAFLVVAIVITFMNLFVDVIIFSQIRDASNFIKTATSVAIGILILAVIDLRRNNLLSINVPWLNENVAFLSSDIYRFEILTVSLSLVFILVLVFFTFRTAFGLKLRAFMADEKVAISSGISAKYVHVFISSVTGISTTVAGFLIMLNFDNFTKNFEYLKTPIDEVMIFPIVEALGLILIPIVVAFIILKSLSRRTYQGATDD